MVCAAPGAALVYATANVPTAYGFDTKAQNVTGSSTMGGAPQLAEGAAYRSALAGGDPVYFRIDLDARRTAYASVVAVPEVGGELTAMHSLQVSLVDAEGTSCDRQSQGFTDGFAQPLALTAVRTNAADAGPAEAKRQQAGTYYVAVSRSNRSAGDAPWQLDLRVDTEAPLKRKGAASPPAAAPSAQPTGAPTNTEGGGGFAVAAPLRTGAAISEIRPGQSQFFRVPIGWGQRLKASVEIAASRKGPYVASAVSVSVYNPARMHADTAWSGYRGEGATIDLDELPAVAYDNRTAEQHNRRPCGVPAGTT
ncbi:hypothetical protein SAMN05421806_13330 [Streptomyces indicus]|uniref:Uncharacterized protein n=2 Tax=Streptomyces indicus TaxID=417292 RepID=A0A1G9JQ06_9ACTN|nr:hypothetical protein SAMN05421806_13330 [Streptomyces indicus]